MNLLIRRGRIRRSKRYVGGARYHQQGRGPQCQHNDTMVRRVRALDPQTGEKKWGVQDERRDRCGILTTAFDLLFTGGREGFFQALDARSGKLLWKDQRGRNIRWVP